MFVIMMAKDRTQLKHNVKLHESKSNDTRAEAFARRKCLHMFGDPSKLELKGVPPFFYVYLPIIFRMLSAFTLIANIER